MSIISQQTAEPNRIEMLINFLRKNKKSYSKLDLEIDFSPPNGKKNSDAKGSTFNDVYSVTEQLGLIEIEKDIVKLKIENLKEPISKIIKESIFKNDFIE